MPDSYLNNTPESPDFEQLYRALVHNLPTCAIFATDVNGRISSWNKGVETNLGYSEPEFLGQPLELIFTEDDRRNEVPALEIERARRNGYSMDRRWHVRKNGTEFFVDGVMTALVDDEGRVIGFSKIMRDATAEHLAEKRLGSALEYAESIVDTIRQPMLVLDGELRVISANRSFYRDFGGAPDVTEGQPLRELGDGQWNIPPLCELLEDILLRESTTEDFELRHTFSGMGEKIMLLNARKLWREINHTQLILLAIEDITERKRAETALVESERQRRAIMNAAPAIISYVDRELRYKWVNGAYERWYGLTPAELTGKTVPEIYPSETFAEMYPRMKRALSGEHVVYDLAVGTTGRETRILQLAYTPDCDDDGQVQGFVVLGSDITEYKRVEAQLREGEEFTHSILASSPDCVKVLDLEGRLLSLTENACRQMEIEDVAACLNLSWLDFWGESRQAAQSAIAGAALGNTIRFEGFCPTRKGTPKWWEVIVTPIRNGSGKPVRLLSLSRDITERRRSEEERERLLQELERSNGELSDFAHVAAHDLQTPLRTILSYAQLLDRQTRGQLDETGREFLQMVLDGAARMDHLVRALLNYAQVGQGTPRTREVPMEAVVGGALENLQASISEQRAEVSHDELPVVMGDSVQLLQLVQNLVSNGIKYARPGVLPRIHIGANRQERTWRFFVQDNGQGISNEYQEQVFQPFRRLHGYEVAGTGMGLAVARKIVERHGGRIWVESVAGEGSTFYFTLPAIQGPCSSAN